MSLKEIYDSIDEKYNAAINNANSKYDASIKHANTKQPSGSYVKFGDVIRITNNTEGCRNLKLIISGTGKFTTAVEANHGGLYRHLIQYMVRLLSYRISSMQ